MSTTTSRIYPVQTHPPEFVTGALPNGAQVLMVPISQSSFVQLLFDATGSLIAAEERTGTITDRCADTAATSTGSAAISAPIKVLSFSVPRYGIGIRQHPEIFDEFVAHPEIAEPQERYRERAYRQISEWDRENRFVLATWGKQYWMNEDGSVFAT